MATRIPQSPLAVRLRLSLSCDLAEVRPVRLAVRDFLQAHGLATAELLACELALAEACNNAIQYASRAGRNQPIEVHVICRNSKVELRVADHTPGFKWPARVKMPASDCECGRGLVFIQFLMDRARYFRGRRENRLVMRKQRFGWSDSQNSSGIEMPTNKSARSTGSNLRTKDALSTGWNGPYESPRL